MTTLAGPAGATTRATAELKCTGQPLIITGMYFHVSTVPEGSVTRSMKP